MTIGITQQQVSQSPLSAEDKGTILFLVLSALFGEGAINAREIGDLLTGFPAKDEQFTKGNLAAYKIQQAAVGASMANDPDVAAAREVVKKIGSSMDFLGTAGGENSQIAGQLLKILFYDPIIAKFGNRDD
jgi:hypothetical protein